MDRRRFLLALAAGLAGASVVQGGGELGDAEPAPAPRPEPAASVAPAVAPAAVVLPPTGVVDALPGPGNSLALTIDDGTSSEVVAAFAALAVDTGIRLTFFPNGCYRSWEDNAAVLRPLVDSGQVALGNHTWSHPDLTALGDREVAEEISRNRAAQAIVLGHANHLPVTTVYGELLDLIADRGLRTVTLADVWATPGQRLRGATAGGRIAR